jgi:two-component system, chemotaxis family, CheB/CheR fusion protein
MVYAARFRGEAEVPSFVVGIAILRGGEETLRALLQAVPGDAPLTFVVMSCSREDGESLAHLVASWGIARPVELVSSAADVRIGGVYVIPFGVVPQFESGVLSTREGPQSGTADDASARFLGALAGEFGEQASGLVLDDSQEDCLYWPKGSAAGWELDPSAEPDLRGDASTFADVLVAKAGSAAGSSSERPLAIDRGLLHAVFTKISETQGIDFAEYKRATLERRILVQTLSEGFHSSEAYLEYALSHPVALEALSRGLLIGVTEFFRDAASFEKLRQEALPQLLDGLEPQQDLRIWCAGCSTGEEAYSLAMLAMDAFALRGKEHRVKVFASDVCRSVLPRAAEGVYPEAALQHLPRDYLARYFVAEGPGQYRIALAIRKCVVFSCHNLIKDPPFGKVDLVSCRNVLIYLEAKAQRQALLACSFALRKGGVLFLGPSETTGSQEREYTPIAREHRIYRKEVEPLRAARPMVPAVASAAAGAGTRSRGEQRLLHALEATLHQLVPLGCLVDDARQVVQLFGRFGSLLHHSAGPITTDLSQLMPTELRGSVIAAVAIAAREKRLASCNPVRVTIDNEVHWAAVSAEPVPFGDDAALYLLRVQLSEAELPSRSSATAAGLEVDAEIQVRIHDLEEELLQARVSLQETVGHLESANEQLQATNEQLQTTNEELQATNEELHAVNQELYGVNQDHETKILELDRTARDLRNLMRETEVGMIFTDRNGDVQMFTPVAAQFFNLLPQDLGRPLAHITPRIADSSVFEVFSRVLSGGEREERRVASEDGRVYLRRIQAYRDADRDVGGVMLAFVDVTDVAVAENALRDANASLEARVSERTRELTELTASLEEKVAERTRDLGERESMFRTMIEGLPDGILMVGQSGEIELSNRRASEIFGVPSGQLSGVQVSDLVPIDRRSVHGGWVSEFVQQDEPRPMASGRVVNAVRPDGTAFFAEVGISPVRLGGRRYALARISDVTERVQAEEKLRESEARFRRSFRGSALGKALLDAEGVLVEANPALCRLLGYAESELCGRRLAELSHEEDRALESAMSWSGRVVRLDKRLRRASGEYIWVRVSTVWIGAEGESAKGRSTPQHLVLIEDSSEVRQAREKELVTERKLQEAAKLESLGVLAGGIAHDFNNILTGILGNAQFVRDELPPEGELSESVDDILTAVRRAAEVCAQMLAYSGRSRFVLSDVNLSSLVLDTERLLRLGLGKTVHLNLEGLALAVPPVRVDRAQIQQVVMNLILNASEAIGKRQGTVRVRVQVAPPELVDEEARDVPWLCLEVEDDGDGIAPEHLKRVFEPFFTTKMKGRGLGLAAVQGIVKAHGGALAVESRVGVGTVFRLLLPCSGAEAVVAEVETAEASTRGFERAHGTILVIDDEEGVRRMLERLLKSRGYDVVCACDGQQGVDFYAAAPRKFAAVLLDLTMPVLDGPSAFRRIRELDPNAKVILISGYSESEATHELNAPGLSGFLKKPIERGDLFRQVQRVLPAKTVSQG